MRSLGACLIPTLAMVLSACGQATSPGGTPSGSGGRGVSAGGGAAGGSNAATGGSDAGGAPIPTDATTTSSDGNSSSERSGDGDGGTGDAPAAGCAPGAVFCDDFESYPLDPKTNLTQDFSPNWLKYKFHGNPYVWTSMSFQGKQNVGLDTEAGDLRYAGIVRQRPDDQAVAPLDHYGRVMFWVKALPPVSDWNFIHLSGLQAGSTTKIAQYSFGGSGGKLAVSYLQRTRILDATGAVALRGGGPQNGDPPADVQCQLKATTQTLPTMKWVCVEWHIDGGTNELHLWLDGKAQTEIDVAGHAGTCSLGNPTAWQAPARFNKLVLDWEAYQKDAPQQNARFDEVVLGTQRIGCP